MRMQPYFHESQAGENTATALLRNTVSYVHNVQAMPLYLDHILYPEVRPCLVSFIVL